MSWSIFLALIGLALAIAAGEVLLLVGGAYYGVRAVLAYKDCMRVSSGRRMTPGRRLRATQRRYWQYVKQPWQPQQLTDAQRWLQAQTGMRLSLLDILKHITAVLAAVMIWPAAMLGHCMILLPDTLRYLQRRAQAHRRARQQPRNNPT